MAMRMTTTRSMSPVGAPPRKLTHEEAGQITGRAWDLFVKRRRPELPPRVPPAPRPAGQCPHHQARSRAARQDLLPRPVRRDQTPTHARRGRHARSLTPAHLGREHGELEPVGHGPVARPHVVQLRELRPHLDDLQAPRRAVRAGEADLRRCRAPRTAVLVPDADPGGARHRQCRCEWAGRGAERPRPRWREDVPRAPGGVHDPAERAVVHSIHACSVGAAPGGRGGRAREFHDEDPRRGGGVGARLVEWNAVSESADVRDERGVYVPARDPDKSVDAFQKLHPMEVKKMVFHDWVTDRWALGGPAWWRPGYMSKYQEELQSRHGNVLFASADWAHGWRAAIDGALEQGCLAAQEVVGEIQPAQGAVKAEF
ncbi:uncharacterized protein DSM5745_03248 [Aspergillus mulundensis]|uniref:Amine oxidase domain-containing protein n=1 Tax=Aspergillus mulundensis TaxID=1810919 RepID=A0A3D8SK00_9EURO|nr:hypothetical protein DSM5745_03248 [Aspergillus mulundensis]RDW86606.1 hypothetical protein DSM5745_03248 [Aspergillus mulundensis]